MKQKGSFRISIGTSSIVMIFVVLCLTVFAVLSFISADADFRLTERTADSTGYYYKADAEMQAAIAKVDALLKKGVPNSAFTSESLGVQLSRLSAGTLQLTVPVDQNRQLQAVLTVPGENGTRFSVTRYQVVVTRPWEEPDPDLLTAEPQ